MSPRAIVVFAAAFAAGVLLNAQSRTVWEGVYTDAQAERAMATYDSVCSRCHTLTGQERGALTGDAFWTAFTQKSVGDLLTYVKTNMPNGNGGSLPPATYNDLVALILKSNGFPAGSVEVSPETVTNVQIIPKDGPGELPANALARVVGCLAKSGNDWVLTRATVPERIDKSVVGATDATRPLGTRSIALKFVLTRLDPFVGQRLSVSGLLIGAGGADGINVTTVNRVADNCL
ncbi:MAG TPA: cytochrome c [Vicinamibacterales bacterium]|nr:cytochrome c [Vicinamibacterales bacterium]